MRSAEWKRLAASVTDAMKEYTRPFVTPMRTSSERYVWLLGTGSYVSINGKMILLTCEHVVCDRAEVHHQFWGSETVHAVQDPFVVDVPLDIAFAPIRKTSWDREAHGARTLLFDGFADRHEPVADELLFSADSRVKTSITGLGCMKLTLRHTARSSHIMSRCDRIHLRSCGCRTEWNSRRGLRRR
jgi:hypothetical protein